MKNRILLYIAAIGLLFTSVSCEDFLDQVNPNELSTGSFWLDLNDCETGLVSVYNAYRNASVVGLADNLNRSDLCYPGWGRPNTTNEYYQQQFTSGSNGVNSMWDGNYKGIFYANQVISGLEGVKDQYVNDEEAMDDWRVCMAQARFFRGVFHFYLYSMYNEGNIIIFDFVPQGEADFAQPLSKAEDVRAFYLADLEYALENLPDEWIDTYKGRLIRPVAAAVLGKSYLYEGEYEKAFAYFNFILEKYDYSLAAVDENMTTKGEFNSESIFELSYDLDYKPEESVWSMEGTINTYSMYFAPSTVGGWRSNLPSLWFQMAMKNDPKDMSDERNWVTDENGNVRLRTHNLRASYTCAWVDDRATPYYGDTCHTSAPFNNLEGAYFRKNTNWDITDSEKILLARSGVNYRMIRLTDIYLMMAECLIKGGSNDAGVQPALDLINKVRYRSALQLLGSKSLGEYSISTYDEQTYSAQDVMDQLMYVERPIELCAEGFCIRYLDLRRWGILKQRFEELSVTPFWFDNFEYYIEEDGKHKKNTKWGAVVQEGENPNVDGVTYYDFEQAAQNFVASEHEYFPIPKSEEDANSRLYEVVPNN